MSVECYILRVTWGPDHPPRLPTNIGPFTSRDDAFAWAGLHVRNGSYEAWPIYSAQGLSRRIGGTDE